MTTPKITVGVSGGMDLPFGDGFGKVTTQELTIPKTLGKDFADKLKANNQTPDLSLSMPSVSLKASSSDLLEILGCKSDICKKISVGVLGGYRPGGVGAGHIALTGDYVHPLTDQLSFVGSLQLGGNIYSGAAFSTQTLDNVSVSGFQPYTALMGGLQTTLLGVPIDIMAGIKAGSGVDLAPGIRASGGVGFTAAVTISVDDIIGRIAGSKKPEAPKKPADPCQEAADAMKIGPTSLGDAVAKCKDSPYPAFKRMGELLMGFDLSSLDRLKDYNQLLMQFTQAIVANGKLKDTEIRDLIGQVQDAWKRTESVAVAKDDMANSPYLKLILLTRELQKLLPPGKVTLDRLADLYDTAIEGATKRSPLENVTARATALVAFYLRFINNDISPDIDGKFRPRADKILVGLLDSAQKDIPEKIPVILTQLINNSGTSTLLQPHKARFIAAAKASGDAASIKSVSAFFGVVAAPAKKGKKPKKHK